MNRFLLSFLTLFFCTLSYAQGPNIIWQHCYGGYGRDGGPVYQTSDGGYFIGGGTDSASGDVSAHRGSADFWPVKLDAAGNITWQHTYGSSDIEFTYSALLTDDGNYVMVGCTYGNDYDVVGNYGNNLSHIWAIKLNANGDLIWQKILGGSGGHDNAYVIRKANDGGYIMIGITGSNDHDVSGNHGYDDARVIKLDTAGNIQWQHCYGGTGYEEGNDIWPTTDGGYILACFTNSTDGDVTGSRTSTDIWLVKIDVSGNIQWQKTFGGSNEDVPTQVRQTTDGGYIVAGNTQSTDGDITTNHGGTDAWIFKLNASGDLVWQKIFGGSGQEYAGGLVVTPDGGCTFGCTTNSTDGDVSGNHGSYDGWLVHLNSNGQIMWSKTYGGPGSDGIGNLIYNNDGSYTISGTSTQNGGDVSGVHENGNNDNDGDVWLFKTGIPNAVPQLSQKQFTIYPNPATTTLTISTPSANDYRITDLLGRTLITGTLTSGNNNVDISTLSNGMYLLQTNNQTTKFIKQ